MLEQCEGSHAVAAAVALSPIPIIAVILMLSTPRAKSNGPAFALAWMLGLAVVSSVVVFVIGAVGSSSSTDDSILWGKVALGVVLLVLALRRWRTRPKPGEPVEMPAWMSTVDGFTPSKAFGLGIVASTIRTTHLRTDVVVATIFERVVRVAPIPGNNDPMLPCGIEQGSKFCTSNINGTSVSRCATAERID